jgi:hypothetical protein
MVMMQVTEKINHWGKEIEVIKSALFVDTIKISRRQSELAKKEDRDCVVRAFMGALDISYDQAHDWVKKNMQREDRKGTFTVKYSKNIIGKTKNGYKVSYIGTHPSKEGINSRIGSSKILVNKQYKKATGYTLKSFMENNPVGRFVLIVQGHAVAVVNGVLYANTGENAVGLYRSVWMGFEIK